MVAAVLHIPDSIEILRESKTTLLSIENRRIIGSSKQPQKADEIICTFRSILSLIEIPVNMIERIEADRKYYKRRENARKIKYPSLK